MQKKLEHTQTAHFSHFSNYDSKYFYIQAAAAIKMEHQCRRLCLKRARSVIFCFPGGATATDDDVAGVGSATAAVEDRRRREQFYNSGEELERGHMRVGDCQQDDP